MERRGWLSGDESEAAVGVQARGRGGTETDEDGDGEGWLQRSRLEASVGVRACGGRREARVVKKGHPCRGWTSPPVAPEGGDDAECAGTCRDAVIVIWSRQSVSLSAMVSASSFAGSAAAVPRRALWDMLSR